MQLHIHATPSHLLQKKRFKPTVFLTYLLTPSLKPSRPTCSAVVLVQPNAPQMARLHFPATMWLLASLSQTWIPIVLTGLGAVPLSSLAHMPPRADSSSYSVVASFYFFKPLMNKLPIHVTTGMNLKTIPLRERSHTWKVRYYDPVWHPGRGTEIRPAVSGGWGERSDGSATRESFSGWCKFSLGGGGYRIIYICQSSSNWTPSGGGGGEFLYKLYLNKPALKKKFHGSP